MKGWRTPPALLLLSGAMGVFLVVIGVLLMAAPRAGERAFGKSLDEQEGDYTFHRATGVRQFYLGALILLLALLGERRALGALLATVCVVPATDFLLAIQVPSGNLQKAFLRHGPSVLLALWLGVHFLKHASCVPQGAVSLVGEGSRP